MNKPVYDHVHGSDTIYVFFAGGAQRVGIPHPEFYKSAQILEHSRLFITDKHKGWYQTGAGLGRNFYEMAEWVRHFVRKHEKIIYVGNCQGAFAALGVNALVRRGKTIAFSPRTNISPLFRLQTDRRPDKFGDYPVQAWLESFHRRTLWDLKPLLTRYTIQADLHADISDPLEAAHTLRMKGVTGIRIVPYAEGGHGLVRLLRKQGKLAEIMRGET